MMGPGYTDYPAHKVDTTRMKERVEVFMQGEKIAETKNAIKVEESGHGVVYYIPPEDIRSIEFIKTGDYECPFKGHAKFLDVKHGSSRLEKAAWTYDRPYDEVMELKNYVAFYPNKVQLIRVTG